MTPLAFIHGLSLDDVPAVILNEARRCLLDLLGVAVSGLDTELSAIVRRHAVRHLGSADGGARLLFDGRRASPAGAAFAGAFTIDSFDAHDGHPLTKGHAGVAVLPALLALMEETGRTDGREMLLGLVIGYEIAIRAGIALHASVADYHTSGAWNALGCAAVAARYLRLGPEETRHALGIAEYHGPRSQMMRVIDHPTMLKDGSGWGALAGVSAAFLAQDGFSGAPAITMEAPDRAELWDDLGTRWRIAEQYFKPYPVCRWAQPAIEAALTLRRQHDLAPTDIADIEVSTFRHAVALGARAPETTEEAQYAIGFPLAAAIAHGRVTGAEILQDGLADAETLGVLSRVRLVEDPALSARFPAKRLAGVTLTLRDGSVLRSPVTAARGSAENRLSDLEVAEKFRSLAASLGPDRCRAIEAAVAGLPDDASSGSALLDLLMASVGNTDRPVSTPTSLAAGG